MNLTIHLNEGLGDLRFGMPVEEAVRLMGQASAVEDTTNALDEPLTSLYYAEEGLTLLFEGENPVLVCIDICNEDALLFDERPFDMTEEEVIFLMAKHGHRDLEVEDEDWGERSLSYGKANVDFFFEHSELVSLQIGQ